MAGQEYISKEYTNAFQPRLRVAGQEYLSKEYTNAFQPKPMAQECRPKLQRSVGGLQSKHLSKLLLETNTMHYVYFLELSNLDIYVGFTSDLKQRLRYHNSGFVLSTKPHLPAKLKSYIAVETETLAIKLEKYFKSGSGKALAQKRLW